MSGRETRIAAAGRGKRRPYVRGGGSGGRSGLGPRPTGRRGGRSKRRPGGRGGLDGELEGVEGDAGVAAGGVGEGAEGVIRDLDAGRWGSPYESLRPFDRLRV